MRPVTGLGSTIDDPCDSRCSERRKLAKSGSSGSSSSEYSDLTGPILPLTTPSVKASGLNLSRLVEPHFSRINLQRLSYELTVGYASSSFPDARSPGLRFLIS